MMSQKVELERREARQGYAHSRNVICDPVEAYLHRTRRASLDVTTASSPTIAARSKRGASFSNVSGAMTPRTAEDERLMKQHEAVSQMSEDIH
jgi:hypothetical protein